MTTGSARAMLTAACPAADRARLRELPTFVQRGPAGMARVRSVPAAGSTRRLGLLRHP